MGAEKGGIGSEERGKNEEDEQRGRVRAEGEGGGEGALRRQQRKDLAKHSAGVRRRRAAPPPPLPPLVGNTSFAATPRTPVPSTLSPLTPSTSSHANPPTSLPIVPSSPLMPRAIHSIRISSIHLRNVPSFKPLAEAKDVQLAVAVWMDRREVFRSGPVHLSGNRFDV